MIIYELSLEIPFLLRYGFFKKKQKSLRPYFLLGPYAAFLKKAVSIIESPGYKDEEDNKNDFKRSDIGFVAGVGLEYKTGPGKLSLEIRFSQSFPNICEEGNDQYNVKHRVFCLMLGFCF